MLELIARQQAAGRAPRRPPGSVTMLLPRLRQTRHRRREVIALVPAHNEEDCIEGTLAELNAQSRPPDWILVICDNCTDRTAELAELGGAKIFRTNANSHKKAGGLNQALDRLLPSLRPADIVVVVDADTRLGPLFMESAEREIEAGAGACGGVFFGEDGGGLLGIFQRAEYARYARQLDRSRGEARVLTGTGSAFTVEAFRALKAARGSGQLPGAEPGMPVPYYTYASLTEDGEITLAMKSLGFRCVSPGDCTVTTEIMTSLGSWWKQRTRWQRGALEDLRAYGRTKVTLPYMLRQVAMGLSVAAFALYITYSAVTITMYGYHTNVFWLGLSAFFILERVLTVRRARWREKTVAALLLPELAYDALQHAVWLWCVAGWLFRTPTDW
jgi:cellulose synthase/poly-beta-1,6-N-acetylglucosamine synthase-like glycosyltransferase